MRSYTDRWTHFYGPSMRGARPQPFWSWLIEEAVPGVFDPAEAWYSVLRHREISRPMEDFVSLDRFERNLGRIVELARGDGARVVLVTQPSAYAAGVERLGEHPLWFNRRFCLTREDYLRRTYPDVATMARAMDGFNDVVRHVAACSGARLAEGAREMDGRIEYFVDDVHYTQEGAAKLASIVAASVEEALDGPRSDPVCGGPEEP